MGKTYTPYITIIIMIELFQYDFMIRAFIAGLLMAVIAPMIGTFLVVRRYSLIADTLSHVALLGVAIGVLINQSPIIIAIIVTVVAALGIEQLHETKIMFGESVLALFLSGSLAIAVMIISIAKGMNVNILSYLFGSITTVSQLDIYIIFILSIIVLGVIIFLYKYLFLNSLDENLAYVSRVPVKFINRLLIIVTAITVSLAMRIVGVLLIGAMMVIPVLSALQLRKGFKITMLISVIFSLISVIVGIIFSYYFDLATGGTIVVVSLLLFVISMFFK
jgi:zinc transport system permease protein